MDTLTAIRKRRSVKHYDPQHTLSEEEFQTLISLVLLSPTSYNLQNWRFLRVRDPELRTALRDAAWNQQQVEEASELIIFCGQLNAYADRPQRYWATSDSDNQTFMVSMMHSFYHQDEQAQRDEVMRSCGIAAQTLMLGAKTMGLDTTAMVGYDVDKVAKIIKLPKNYIVSMMVVIGRAKVPPRPRGGQLPLEDILWENTFS